MKEKLRELFTNLKWPEMGVFRNKYVLAGTLFIIWVSVFDENNLFERGQNLHKLSLLAKDTTYYNLQIIKDSERLKELKTNKANLEKFAREQYLMKKDNEDVFVIVHE